MIVFEDGTYMPFKGARIIDTSCHRYADEGVFVSDNFRQAWKLDDAIDHVFEVQRCGINTHWRIEEQLEHLAYCDQMMHEIDGDTSPEYVDDDGYFEPKGYDSE